MKYKLNVFTKTLDMVRSLTGAGTTPTSQKTVYVELLTTGTPFAHNANAQWTGAEVLTLAIADYFTLANEIKSQYNLHIADGGALAFHPVNPDAIHVITAPDATDWASLLILITDIVTQYDLHDADANLAAAWLYHGGQNTVTHSLSIPAYTWDNVATSLIAIKNAYNAHDNDMSSHDVNHMPLGGYQITASDVAVVWNDSIYVPRQDPADVLNSAIIDSVVSEYAKITLYFG